MNEMNKDPKGYTVGELEKMIKDYIDYWSDPSGKGDHDVSAANALSKSALPIAQQLVAILKSSKE